MKKLYVIGYALILAACSPKTLSVKWKESGLLSGQVYASRGSSSIAGQSANNSHLISVGHSSSKLSSMPDQKTISVLDVCTNPSVALYEMSTDGQKTGSAVGTASVESNGTYKIKLPFKKLPADKTYLVEVSGCTENMSRVVTEQSHQDISVGTSLLSSWLPNSDVADKLVTADKSILKSLLNSVRDTDSYTLAYSTILNNSALNSDFQRVFGVSPTTLKNVAPEKTELVAPTTLTEGTPVALSMVVKHWSPEYQFAYKWMVDDVVIGTSANVSYIPHANMQGAHTLKVFYGARDSSNELDLTKPYKQKSIAINILNAQPALVPSVSLTSGSLVSSRALHIALDTGAARFNCNSFSRLAIKEDIPTSPLLEAEFLYTCDTAGTQDLLYNLVGADGAHALYIWTQDAAGNISAAPRVLNVVLDTTHPVLTVGSLATGSRVKGSFTLSGTCEAGTNVQLSGSGAVGQTTTCSSGVFSTLASLTSGEATKALTLSQTDLAGNTSNISISVLRDDTAPAPVIASPAAGSTFQATFTLAGNCSTGVGDNQNVTITSTGVSGSPLATVCSSGSFSQSLTLTGSDGLKTVVISQLDEAGNSGSSSIGILKDTTAPTINLAAPAANFRTQSGVVLSGTCEDGTISLTGDTTSTTTTCSSGSFSQAVSLNGADGSKTITLTQTDSAGNTGSTSRSFLKDTSAPDLNITAPSTNDRFQSIVTVSGTCEAGGRLDFTGSDITPISNVTCPGSGNFSQSITLSGVDGAKTFTVEHRDSLSNLSTASVSVVKDNIAPTLALTSPAAMTNSQSTLTLTGTCGTATGDQSTIILESTSVDGAPLTTSCSSGNFSQLITLSGSDGTKSLTLKQKDSANNEFSVTRSFVKDTTAPILAITSPNSLASFQNTLTLTGTCETGLTVNISGDATATTAVCSGSSFSTSVTLSATDGAKLITVSQTDAASNSGSVSRTFYKDTTAPAITFSSPAAGTNFQSMVAISGTCEAGLTISYSGDISSPSNTTCASGSFSDTVTLTAGQGSKTLTLSQTDAAGNVGSQSLSVMRDNTAPLIAFTSPTANSNYQNSVTVSGSCGALSTDISSLTLSGPFTGSPMAINCISGNFSSTVSLTGADGLKALSIVQLDQAANSSTANLNLYKDTTAPAIVVTTPGAGFMTKGSVTATGTCESGLTVVISGSLASSVNAACSSGTFSQALTISGSDGSASLSFVQTDGAGNTVTVNRSLTKDSTSPNISLLQINSGAGSTTNPNVLISLNSNDATTLLTAFCLKYVNATTPLVSDSCWVPFNNPSPGLTLSQSLSMTAFPFQLGVGAATYTVNAWVKDQLDNISTVSNAAISYVPGLPPEVRGLLAGQSNTPDSTASYRISSTGSVFIKWKAFDNEGLDSAPITLQYTTDDSTFTTIASNLTDAQGAGCTKDDAGSALDDGFTGCYVWSSGVPTSGYLKIRAVVKDSAGFVADGFSAALNISRTKIVAGNTSASMGVSGKSAVLFYQNVVDKNDAHNFVVTNNGDIYYNDYYRGLLKIDAQTGLVSTFLRVTGTTSGGNVDVSTATAKSIFSIHLDFDNNLYIYDDLKIRRIDLKQNPPKIYDFIGGGSTNSDDMLPNAAVLWGGTRSNQGNRASFTFQPLPNGDIFLTLTPSAGVSFVNYSRLYKYDHTDGRLKKVTITPGVGDNFSGTQDASLCGVGQIAALYDPTTSVVQSFLVGVYHQTNTHPTCPGAAADGPYSWISKYNADGTRASSLIANAGYAFDNRIDIIFKVGMNGELYRLLKQSAAIHRYNKSTNTWTRLVGTGTLGDCADGTAATACLIAPEDLFVNSTGKVYFFDRGRIRMIDDNNLVQTLAGQAMGFGDGVSALSARIGGVRSFDYSNSGNFYFSDSTSSQLKSFSIGGVQVNIAGSGVNSTPSTTILASTTGITFLDWTTMGEFALNRSSEEIYMSTSKNYISRLNRASGKWENFAGGGATEYMSADGLSGAAINLNSAIGYVYGTRILGISNDKLSVGMWQYANPGMKNRFIKSMTLASGVQQNLLGIATSNNTGDTDLLTCADGALTSSCYVSGSTWMHDGKVARLVWDSSNTRWLVTRANKTIRTVPEGAGATIGTLTTTANDIRNFDYYESADHNTKKLYYCDTSGRLRFKNLITGVETALTWEINTLSCTGNVIQFNPTTNKLYFIGSQNNLQAIVEYDLN